MRPPLSATPPVSHVISRQFQPTPALTCADDWRDLTSNNSIQILSLETSQCHEDSLFQLSDVSNQLKFVDTIISPRQDGVSPWQYGTSNTDISDDCVAQTIVSLDSLTHHHGNTLDARIIFTPKERCHDRRTKCLETEQEVAAQLVESRDCIQQLSRNCYSDSDLYRMNNSSLNKEYAVARSKSLSYAKHLRKKNDTGLVKPLMPCVYKSKVGGVKKIASFRNTARPVSVAVTRTLNTTVKPVLSYITHTVTDTEKSHSVLAAQTSENKSNIVTASKDGKTVSESESRNKPVDSVKTHKMEVQQSKIAKFVKNGLKSVMHSNEYQPAKVTKLSESRNAKAIVERRRYRRTRCSTDIGGLSEFLRRNERRKTVEIMTDITEKKEREFETQDHVKAVRCVIQNSADINDFYARLSPVEEKNTPKSIFGCRRLHSTGTSNLRFNQCQRKLDFQGKCASPKANIDLGYLEYFCCEEGVNSQTKRRPRMGTLGNLKPGNVVSIDDLEMDLVCDLKRRVERAVRGSRIKTNGTLKIKLQTQLVDKALSSSPRRFRGNGRNGQSHFEQSVRHVQLKRESIV